MEFLRTPDERFADLVDWPYEPHYTEIPSGDGTGTLRVHHVDEGPPGADPILCLHGEPSWGYLYRKMIPLFSAAGRRALVPDLIGFGRSDKPVNRSDYTYQRHVDWMAAWLEAVDLRHATLVCQDWGGLVGLRLAAEHPDRFDRLVVANTFLPVGDRPPSEAFLRWRAYSQDSPTFNIGRIVEGGSATRPLPPAVVAAYDAPFPDDRYKAGARQFPVLVPISPEDPAAPANRKAWEVLERWEKPALCRVLRTTIRSRLVATAPSRPVCRGRVACRIRPSPAPATSSRKTGERSSPVSWSTFCPRRPARDPVASRRVPRGGPVPSVPGFLPSRNGFHFANHFEHLPLRTIDLVVTKLPLGDAANGLCGGMAYAVRDLFEAGRLPPPDTTAPGEGPLFDYLVERLLDSYDLTGPDPAPCVYYRLMSPALLDQETWWATVSGQHSRAWVMVKEAWPAIQKDVDAGHLSPLGMIGLLSWDPRLMGVHHQVLVWGYTLTGTQLVLNLYDPNGPDQDDNTMSLDIGNIGEPISVSRTPPSNHPVFCFFPTDYAPKVPP